MTVTHAQITRAGIAVPFHVRVTHAGGFDGPLSLAISEGLLERFDFQNLYPNPSAETATADYVYYEFDQNGSTTVYRTVLVINNQPVTDVSFRLWVVP